MTTTEGAAWLEAMAARFEETARLLRETAARVREGEALLGRAPAFRDDHGGDVAGPVTISEAIRRALGAADGKPLRPGAIWDAIRAQRIPLQTRSQAPRNMIDSTLASMERSRQVRKVKASETDEGGWVLTSI